MALFGAPAAHEDDPERAVRAALAIREWAERRGRRGADRRQHRRGARHARRAARRPARRWPPATSSTPAARLQSAAPVNGILAGEQTYRATERAIEYEDAEPVEAKGKAQPVPAWLAVDARSRVAVERVHGATLVGRRREVDLLVGALDRVLDGAVVAARHGRRRARDRQEPARARALRARSSAVPS